MQSRERDGYVDWFKGLIILWVIHIHTVFWSGYAYIPDFYRQVTLLIDIPVFFFISGYLTRPGPFIETFLKTARQFLRLYGHYLAISFLLLSCVLIIKPLTIGGSGDIGLAAKSLVVLAPRGDLMDIIRVYGGSIWFLRVYLSMLVVVPFLLGVAPMVKIKYLVVVLLLLLSAIFPEYYPNRTFLFSNYGSLFFYLFFFMLGVLFREHEDYLDFGAMLLATLLSIGLALIVFDFDQGRLKMQPYKFPPSTQYMIYSLVLVHVFGLLKKCLPEAVFNSNFPGAAFFQWCGRNVFTIYLFQGAVCSLPYFFIDSLLSSYPPVMVYGIVLTFNLALTLFLAFGYSLGQSFLWARIKSMFGEKETEATTL